MPKSISITAITLEQEADSCDTNSHPQSLEIKSQDVGGGEYFVIKTDRWAVDSISELVAQLKEAAVIPYHKPKA